jgi:hypothetical protein
MQFDDVIGGSRTADSSRGGSLPDDDSGSTNCPVSQHSVLVRSIFEFDEDQTGVHVKPNGLVLPDGISFDSWRELGSRVAHVVNCSAWWLGDWLLYGEHAYSDRYEQAISDTSLGYQTLRNYAWVARKFPMSRRRDTLSFGHHAEVAALPDDEQDVWLARAQRLSWSRNQLRRGLRAAKLVNRRTFSDEESRHTRALRIDVSTERHDRWQSAAERKNCSVVDWIIVTLDCAASAELSTRRP